MSHWAKYSATVLNSVEMPIFQEALKELGLTYDESVKHLGDNWGSADVDGVLVRENGERTSLGLNIEDAGRVRGKKHYKVTVNGDFWNTGFDEYTFCNTLSQIYMKINAQAKLRLQGWSVTKVETDSDGKVHIHAQRRSA